VIFSTQAGGALEQDALASRTRRLPSHPHCHYVDALSRQNPVLMIFEHAHWTDPTSLEVFGWIIDRMRSLRVLLIVTFRPEFEPSSPRA
jgi:predicted ATPase